jgi:AbrB family looped-hinge helix DNA binding protein
LYRWNRADDQRISLFYRSLPIRTARSESTSIQLRKRGALTLPKALREKHNLKEGDSLHLVDLGGGSFVLTPTKPRIPELTGALERIREDEGVSMEDMLTGLRKERRRHGGEAST